MGSDYSWTIPLLGGVVGASAAGIAVANASPLATFRSAEQIRADVKRVRTEGTPPPLPSLAPHPSTCFIAQHRTLSLDHLKSDSHNFPMVTRLLLDRSVHWRNKHPCLISPSSWNDPWGTGRIEFWWCNGCVGRYVLPASRSTRFRSGSSGGFGLCFGFISGYHCYWTYSNYRTDYTPNCFAFVAY